MFHRDPQSRTGPRLHPSPVPLPLSNPPRLFEAAPNSSRSRRARSHRTKHPGPSAVLPPQPHDPPKLYPNSPRRIRAAHLPQTSPCPSSAHQTGPVLQSASNTAPEDSPSPALLFRDARAAQRRPPHRAEPPALQYPLSLPAVPVPHPPRRISIRDNAPDYGS